MVTLINTHRIIVCSYTLHVAIFTAWSSECFCSDVEAIHFSQSLGSSCPGCASEYVTNKSDADRFE